MGASLNDCNLIASSNANPPVSETKEMKVKLIRCLTSLSSPTLDAKKRRFCRLVKEDEEAMLIVKVAVENRNSVEDTASMLLNFL